MLQLEELERRDTPSASIVHQGTAVTVYGEPSASNTITADASGDQIKITVNGQIASFNASEVERLYLIGGDQSDFISNNTTVNSSIYGLEGGDVINAFAGNDFIVPGPGSDSVTDYLGLNFVYTNEDQSEDFIFTNAKSYCFTASNDQVFVLNQPFLLSNQVIYLQDSNFYVYKDGASTVVIDITNGESYTVTKKVEYVAFLGENELILKIS